MRRALIGYLRWSARRHWTVKVATAFLVLPIYLQTPRRRWDAIVEEAFG